MKYFFDGGWYSPDVHLRIPSGAVGVSDERWAELLDAQSRGCALRADGEEVIAVPAAASAAGVPRAVTMRGARVALLRAGLLDGASAVIAAAPGASGEELRIAWEYATSIPRDSALVSHVATALGLDAAAIDALFVAAAAVG